jgi:adenosylhomocysteine nucleosidase
LAARRGHDPESVSGVAILYALPDEMRFAAGFERLVVSAAQSGARILRHEAEKPCALCVGVGARSASENAGLLLAGQPSVTTVLIVGFAGGLASGMGPGSLVAATTVIDLASGLDYEPDPLLLALAQATETVVPLRSGALVTADRVVTRAAEKQELARSTGAIAVDMETAAAAAAATEYGVPWLALRVITDGVDDDLPLDFNSMANPDGSVNRSRIVAHTLLHPWKVPALMRLGARSSLAALNLAAFLHAFVPAVDTL